MVDTPPLQSATANSDGSITVSWSSVGDADYYVYRKIPNGSWKRIVVVKGTSLQYTDSTTVSNTTYLYTVRAYHEQSQQLSSYVKNGISTTAK